MLSVQDLIKNHQSKKLDKIPEEIEPIEENTNNLDNNNTSSDMFLSFLESDKFIPNSKIIQDKEMTEKQRKEYNKQIEKEEKKNKAEMKEQERLSNKLKREEEKRNKQIEKDKKKEEDNIFSEKGSELYGKDKFTFNILKFCCSKSELAYFEAKEQFDREVLLKEDYYNGIINLRIGKVKITL